MPKVTIPKVFVIAETRMVGGFDAFLGSLGVASWHTDAETDAEKLIEAAGKSCYLSFDKALNKNLTRVGTRNNHDYIQEQIIATKHGSVLEHATVTFAFVDVSRVFTHELVRHRVGAAYSQVSGRYVRADNIGYFLPEVIKQSPGGPILFEKAFAMMEDWIKQLETLFAVDTVDFHLKKQLTSAFRRLIGNGQSNHIIATFNHRTIRHLIELRTVKGAEEEIRHVFSEVGRLMLARYPAIYHDMMTGEEQDGIHELKFKAGRV